MYKHVYQTYLSSLVLDHKLIFASYVSKAMPWVVLRSSEAVRLIANQTDLLQLFRALW